MLVGLVFTSVYIFLYKGWFFVPGTNTYPDTAANYFFGISPLSIGAVGAVLNFVCCVGLVDHQSTAATCG